MPISKEKLNSILDKLKKTSDASELYFVEKKQLKIDVLNQRIESIDELEEAGLSVRLVKDGRMGFSYTADFDDAAIEDTIENARSNAGNSSQDEWSGLPESSVQKNSPDLVDEELDKVPLVDKKALCLEIEKNALQFDPRIKKPEKTSYQEDRVRTMILNSKGVDITYEKTVCGAFSEVIAVENGLMETGSWISFKTRYKQIDPAIIGKEAGKRAVAMLGAGREKSGRAEVILSPYVASIMLSMLSPALSAESVQKGKSLFAGAEGKPVASRAFTLIDSGILPEELATVPYDDEGTPTRETPVIQNGTFTGYLYDALAARKAKRSSSGNAFRASFRSQPEITPTNLFVRAGNKSQDELVSRISKGFLVETIMGAHTINSISGEFSIGFSGHYIENGKLSRPVRGMTIAGNLLSLLNRVEEVGSDIVFFPLRGNIGSPSILVSGLSISGI